ncbi:uncharacterized protein LOC100863813 [Apis florea]|uniref:uncharacterized protein LOC100863813 n=1 Tax=Apis florea TaxID=7463 RepID=UPI0012FEDF8D|nr:uncharacterized protein LOC100863813 [Apis florea]
MILRVLYGSRYLTRKKMDVFDTHYHSYRTVLKIIGLWPYNNSIYVWIQRLLLFTFFLGNVIFQIVSLLRSKITLRNCTLILSTTCPLIIISLRYVSFIIFFPMIKHLFNHIRMEESIVQDSIETEIRAKYVHDFCHMIEIFLRVTCATFIFYSVLLLYVMILDFVMPFNESRIYILDYFTLFSINRTVYFYILCLNFFFVLIFGLLSVISTESILGLFSYHAGVLFKIISYRIQRNITYLTTFNLSSKQIDTKLAELYRVVDIHNQAIQLINILINNSGKQFLMSTLLTVISIAVNLHRLVNAIIAKKDQLEIIVSFIFFVNQLVFMFFCNRSAQILINNSEEFFHELYISVWYFVPLNVQKILLLIMTRSSTTCMFHMFGVFFPCHAGFTTMLSTSFSYFTLMYSIQ